MDGYGKMKGGDEKRDEKLRNVNNIGFVYSLYIHMNVYFYVGKYQQQ
jgi:hypothetical protein